VLRPYGAERVDLFGSFVRGEADDLSDVDLVMIKRPAPPFWERLRELARLLPPALELIDVLVCSPAKFSAMLANSNAFAQAPRRGGSGAL
jgi:predicted nucleotidyltransferase